MHNISFIPLIVLEKTFDYLTKNLCFMSPWQPIKFSDLDKSLLKCRGLFQKHFCKKSKYPHRTKLSFSTFFILSLWKRSVFISTRVLIRLQKQKTQLLFPTPIDAICELWKESASWLQRRCRLKMLTDGWTTYVCIYYMLTYEPSAQVS